MSLHYFALVMGMVGSLHCAGMCGPIILSMPFVKENHFTNVVKQLSYHIGRILIYVLLGFAAATFGSTISIFADQKSVSLVIGTLMIVLSFLFLAGIKFKFFNAIHNQSVLFIGKHLGQFYPSRFFPFLAGMFNGIIPCGMVYVALGITANAGTALEGGKFMLFFGLGTIPLLLSISLGGVYLRRYFQFNHLKMIPVAGIIMGTLFITRALEFNIPFFSPQILEALNSFCSSV